MWYNTGMKTIAENATDFADLRTSDRGSCIYVDKTYCFHRQALTELKNMGN